MNKTQKFLPSWGLYSNINQKKFTNVYSSDTPEDNFWNNRRNKLEHSTKEMEKIKD